MSARRVSRLSSSTFDREPTETKSVLPSFENSRSRVQWPPPPTRSRPLGIFSTSISAGPLSLRVAVLDRGSGRPSRCCRRTRASGLAPRDKTRFQTDGCRPVANTSFSSALPSPSASRRILIRLGMLSATNMSPLGAVTILRGFRKPTGEFGDLRSPWGPRHGAAGRRAGPREIVRRRRIERLGKVVDRDPAADARRVGRPVAKSVVAGQHARSLRGSSPVAAPIGITRGHRSRKEVSSG